MQVSREDARRAVREQRRQEERALIPLQNEYYMLIPEHWDGDNLAPDFILKAVNNAGYTSVHCEKVLTVEASTGKTVDAYKLVVKAPYDDTRLLEVITDAMKEIKLETLKLCIRQVKETTLIADLGT